MSVPPHWGSQNTPDAGSADFLAALEPGDVLLFSRHDSVFGTAISVKTWSRFTHVEAVIRGVDGVPGAAASRNGVGVHLYPLDLHGLALVLRPPTYMGTFDAPRALQWFRGVDGQGYDWVGLLNFTYARAVGPDNGKMFCSEFVTRFLRAGRVDLFPENDADTIAPRDFATSAGLKVYWRSPAEWVRWQNEQVRWEEQVGS